MEFYVTGFSGNYDEYRREQYIIQGEIKVGDMDIISYGEACIAQKNGPNLMHFYVTFKGW